MLSEQLWIRLQPYMKTEWRQCMDEGLSVEKFEIVCSKLEEAQNGREEEAGRIALEMQSCPVRPGYAYKEPSGLTAIKAASSHVFPVFGKVHDIDSLREKINGAWTGRIVGCLLGKPVEGMYREKLWPMLRETGNFPMHKYMEKKDFTDELIKGLELNLNRCWRDTVGEIIPPDDDTNYTVFAMKLLETYGPNFTSEDVMEGWLRWLPMLATCTAERAAYRNAGTGILPPETATYRNPFREWIGAQIRGDFFGYINPGNPESAAESAYRDASVSHVKNGIYGEMWVAAMLAAAAVCGDVTDVIQAGLAVVPAMSRLSEDVRAVMDWHSSGVPADEAIERVHAKYNEYLEHDWCKTCPNAMIVTLGLLYANGDFGRGICLAVQAAFDTDCNGATVGSVLGMMLGRSGISPGWAFTDKLQTSIEGYNIVTVSALTDKTMKMIEMISDLGCITTKNNHVSGNIDL